MFKRGSYYVEIIPNHHLADKDGYVYIHRLNAEKKLGRKLKSTECVHHIDENKLNNDLENLMVFKTKADHTAFHKGCDIYLNGDVWVAKCRTIYIDDKKMEKCPICGDLMSYGASMCISCRNDYKLKNSKRPSKEELLVLILKYPIIRIGEIYGVSDNAVRKWLKSYGLPFKKNDIKKLTS